MKHSEISAYQQTPLQLPYQVNGSSNNVIVAMLHTNLSRLRTMNLFRGGFINYKLAFNTIVLIKLVTKLQDQGLSKQLCNWIPDFLKGRPQIVRIGSLLLPTLSTGAPKGCRVSPLPYSLFKNGVPKHSANTILNISDTYKLAYTKKVRALAAWCSGKKKASKHMQKRRSRKLQV